ncbi:hypothetical protein [Rugosimonospora africana]|uniref:Uncharacterized protein n=1 Tax=Rugosimonospora africana TaxID=556532 RepID=A0A8J3QJQ9_9ACTN|nr:hypothetical protein [Rugosimonospora africana]GIH12254.1 hypothetical protein Raf01_04260 [Rugosimonospora africana]
MDEVSIVGHFVMHELLFDVREALTIWLGLVALTALVCVVLSLSSQRGRERRAARRAQRARRAALRHKRKELARAAARASRVAASDSTPTLVLTRVGDGGRTPVGAASSGTDGDRAADPVAELNRYAAEVAVAASRASVTAERRRQEWHAVHNAQQAAWSAYEAADRAARRAIEAAAFPLPADDDPALSADEAQRRERYLLRAATGAYHRGELTIEQLSAAMMHRNGWDPRLHPFEQDLILRCAGRSRLLRTYQGLSEIERTAWHQADMAAAARRSLNEEAFAAAMRVHRAQHPVPAPARRAPASTEDQGRATRPSPVARGRVGVQWGRGVTTP